MNFDVGEQSGLVLWRRFGVLCAQAFFRPPATMPAADVLYCDYFSGLPSSNYGYYVKCHEDTLEIDLLQPEEELLKQLSQSVRAKIRRAETREAFELKAYSPEDLSRSSDILMQFADFYDAFARNKALPPLCRDDLLTQSRAELLWLTCVQKDGETLVWRCYVADHGRARLRFACSHFRQLAPDLRNLIGVAHCWLIWQNVRMFRANGFTIYDFGGWYAGTEDQGLININRFKEGFGGVQARVCSLEIPLTLRGRIYLWVKRTYKRFPRHARDASVGEDAHKRLKADLPAASAATWRTERTTRRGWTGFRGLDARDRIGRKNRRIGAAGSEV